ATGLLKDETALVVGGEVNGRTISSLEFYDPVAGRFDQAPGVLSAERTKYALAVLDDGRVVIAGGMENGRVLDSIDVFDPAEGVRYAGRMSISRANFTATTLSNGNVLFAGGTDGLHELASPELFDPASGDITPAEPMSIPRQNHLAVGSANTNAVLIAGGMSGGRPTDSAEIFVLERNGFSAALEATTATQD